MENDVLLKESGRTAHHVPLSTTSKGRILLNARSVT
jgi:hypothetical protein